MSQVSVIRAAVATELGKLTINSRTPTVVNGGLTKGRGKPVITVTFSLDGDPIDTLSGVMIRKATMIIWIEGGTDDVSEAVEQISLMFFPQGAGTPHAALRDTNSETGFTTIEPKLMGETDIDKDSAGRIDFEVTLRYQFVNT